MDYKQIRARVEKRINQRNEFLIHFSIYIAVHLLLWMIWATSGGPQDHSLPWPLYPMFGWGIGLLAHGLVVFFNSGTMEERKERAIQREIERERLRMGGAMPEELDKPKRDEAKRKVYLSDDGELIDDEDLLHTTSKRGR